LRFRPSCSTSPEPYPDPGGTIGDEQNLVGLTQVELSGVRQEQSVYGIGSTQRPVDDRIPGSAASAVVAHDVDEQQLRFLPIRMEAAPTFASLAAALVATDTNATAIEGDDDASSRDAIAQAEPRRMLSRSGTSCVPVGDRADRLDIEADSILCEMGHSLLE